MTYLKRHRPCGHWHKIGGTPAPTPEPEPKPSDVLLYVIAEDGDNILMEIDPATLSILRSNDQGDGATFWPTTLDLGYRVAASIAVV